MNDMKHIISSYGYVCQPSDFAKNHLYSPLGMGYIVNDPNFKIDRSYLHGHLIMFCISGKLHIEQYHIVSTLQPGQSCLMTLEDAHKYYSDSENPCELLWLHFSGKHVKETLSLIFESAEKYVIIEQSSVFSLLQNCIMNYESDSIGSCFTNSANTYQLLTIFLEKTIRTSTRETIYISPLTKQPDSFINEHIREKITLQMMAEQCHLNPSYFCRRFHSETNMTPMQYLMQKRIESAKYYLIYTQEQMSMISEELGFYNQNHFSVCFLKATGLSPTQYRKQNQKILEL